MGMFLSLFFQILGPFSSNLVAFSDLISWFVPLLLHLVLHGWLISLGGVIFSEVKQGGSKSEGDKRQRGLKGKEAKDIVIGMYHMREE